MPFHNSEVWNPKLPRYLSICNRIRSQSALSGRSLQQRLNELVC